MKDFRICWILLILYVLGFILVKLIILHTRKQILFLISVQIMMLTPCSWDNYIPKKLGTTTTYKHKILTHQNIQNVRWLDVWALKYHTVGKISYDRTIWDSANGILNSEVLQFWTLFIVYYCKRHKIREAPAQVSLLELSALHLGPLYMLLWTYGV